MSKPDDIPQDVWDAASKVATAPRVTGALFSENYVLPVARAILAERERCKEIAALFIHRRLYKANFPACSYHSRDVMDAMDSVTSADLAAHADDSAAIRKGGN